MIRVSEDGDGREHQRGLISHASLSSPPSPPPPHGRRRRPRVRDERCGAREAVESPAVCLAVLGHHRHHGRRRRPLVVTRMVRLVLAMMGTATVVLVVVVMEDDTYMTRMIPGQTGGQISGDGDGG